jgi:hypothetical protein
MADGINYDFIFDAQPPGLLTAVIAAGLVAVFVRLSGPSYLMS